MKKAQIIGQIFIFVLAAALFVLILGYGYKAIKTLLDRQEDVALLELKVDLESSVDRIKLSYGSVEKVELRIPKKYNEICIVDPGKCSTISGHSELMARACEAKTENVFLVPKQKVPMLLKDIEIAKGHCCIKSEGKIALRFEGKGNRANIKNWPGQTIISGCE